MPPRGHSVCSPSSAKRWINCPPSAIANAEAPRKDTVFTREGTLAHEFCEVKAMHKVCGIGTDEQLEVSIASLKENELWQEEMDRHTDRYVDCLLDFVSEFPDKPNVFLEQSFSFEPYIHEGFGTADCIMVGTDRIHVVDFKYGKGVEVDAVHNPQMMIYALGAYLMYGMFTDIKTVTMSIVQPRLSHEPSTWSMSLTELLEWADEVVRPAADLANKGLGNKKCGDWCKWCVNEGKCRTQYNDFADYDKLAEESPDKLTDAEILRAIDMGVRLDAWIKALKEYAMQRCLDGGEVPGLKVVEGRTTRTWSDEREAFRAAIADGIPEEMLYERKPITLSAMETLMGKKRFGEVMRDYVIKPQGKPTLVSASDKREAIHTAQSAANDFGTTND